MVKALRAQYASSPENQALMKKEYDILSMFDRPYIVKACDYCDIAPYGKCIVMEWVDGIKLKEWLQGQHIQNFSWKADQRNRRMVAWHIVDAVEYIHSLQKISKPPIFFLRKQCENIEAQFRCYFPLFRAILCFIRSCKIYLSLIRVGIFFLDKNLRSSYLYRTNRDACHTRQ